MSDGAGGSARDYEARENKKRLGGDDFARAIANISVAQVCDSVGFQGFQRLALNTLSDVGIRYIHQLGKNGSLYANLAGRSESNALDTIQGLEDLGLPQGFAGACDTNHCLTDSGIVREIIQYVNEVDEISSAYLIPKFPAIRDERTVRRFTQIGETPPIDHIPSWLPAFPDPRTYSHEEVDNRTDNIELVKEQKMVDRSMLSLLQHMPCNGSEFPSADAGDAAKAKQAAESNPFLSAPLRFEEKEVSSLVLPPKLLDGSAARDSENHVSMFESLSPFANTMKSLLNDSGEGRGKIFTNTRPTIQFKLKSFKKSSCTHWSHKINDSDKRNSLFEDNSVKYERKKEGGANFEGTYG